jgi:hypothetical protein
VIVTPKAKPRKTSQQHGKTYGEGGDTSMLGKDDRTRVAVEDSAGPQTPGRTSQKSKANPKFAEGGTKRQAAEGAEGAVRHVRVAGGEAYRALPGATGTGTEVIPPGEKVWHGGRKI